MSILHKWTSQKARRLRGSGKIRATRNWSLACGQWRNRRGAECPPRLLTGKFLLPYREKRGKKTRENGAVKRRKIGKGRVENQKWKEEKLQNEGRTFFFFLFFFLLFNFQNHWNLFWVYQNGNFLPGRKTFTPGKKSGKMTLPPLKNIPLTPLHAPKRKFDHWLGNPLLHIPKITIKSIFRIFKLTNWLKLVGEYVNQTFIGFSLISFEVPN